MHLSADVVIFNSYEGSHKKLINMMILIVKQYINAAKCKRKTITFMEAMTRIIEFQKTENLIAWRKKQKEVHLKKWKPFIEM